MFFLAKYIVIALANLRYNRSRKHGLSGGIVDRPAPDEGGHAPR